MESLEHAFRVAHEELGIERLLDAEGKKDSTGSYVKYEQVDNVGHTIHINTTINVITITLTPLCEYNVQM